MTDFSHFPRDTRAVGDVASTRQRIFKTVRSAISSVKPVSNARYKLTLTDVDYDEKDPEHFTLAQQKEAILGGQTLGRRIRGTWRMQAPGEPPMLKRTTLTKVPYMTSRGTFILDGTEYTISSQQRLLPGIFTRQRETGEIESHVNVAKGFGHHYSLDPDKGKFKIRIGQANVPLLPVMKALGATDKQIRDAWGADIYVANVEKNPEKALRAMYTKLYKERPATNETMMEGIQKAFNDMVLDPEVTKSTLGKGYDRVNTDTILAATRKIIDVYKGNSKPDDRDALNYQKIVGPEDIFSERFKKASNIIRQVLWKNTPRNSLDRVPVGAFDDLVRGVIFDSGLGNPLAEINNIELLDHQYRITRMGQGGIESLNAIPYESRMVQPTQMGYLDPVTTPECNAEGTEVLTKAGWKLWEDVTEDDEFACLINDNVEYHYASKLTRTGYDGLMYGCKTNATQYLVTPDHRLYIAPVEHPDSWHFITAKALWDAKPFRYYLRGEDNKTYFCDSAHDNYIVNYTGTVYCATVPGGLVCVLV